MEKRHPGTSFDECKIESSIDIIDQLNTSVSFLRGVSDSLLTLSVQANDNQEALRLFSEVTVHQAIALERIENHLENSLSSPS